MQTSEHEHIHVRIHSPYPLSDTQVQSYKDSGFVRLPGVFDAQTLAHYTPTMSLEVAKADKAPLEEDSDYQKAFTQIMNIWVESKPVKEFVLGQKLGRIASELMGVDGVRIYHDQALNKEPGGGYTPWHCDGYYWPLQSDKVLTAWVPLQAVPKEMGPLQFAARSHTHDLGRDLGIGWQAHKTIDAAVKQGGFDIISEPFQLGEVSFHSGWTFHQAAGNGTDTPREVFTIIFMDKDMIMAEPINHNQRLDHHRWLPGVMPGKDCRAHRHTPDDFCRQYRAVVLLQLSCLYGLDICPPLMDDSGSLDSALITVHYSVLQQVKARLHQDFENNFQDKGVRYRALSHSFPPGDAYAQHLLLQCSALTVV
ncbi:hypothetical protein WJX77_009099 [Trebouxia sp. C0004]